MNARPWILALLLPAALLAGPPAGSLRAADSAAAALPAPGHAIVVREATIVFDQPDVLANALRLLYVGEVIEVAEVISDPEGVTWAKVEMGEVSGYVKEASIRSGQAMKVRNWRPPVILRDEKPLAFGARSGGEMFGPGLNIHYMPFSRLGATFSVGSILDWPEMHGTSLALGMVSYLALHDLSPFVESGFARLSYHQNYSTLRVTAFYLSVGIEWLTPSGVFVNLMVTYLRSVDMEVSFEYADARSNNVQIPDDFGVLDPGPDNTFQFVLPGVSVGYAF